MLRGCRAPKDNYRDCPSTDWLLMYAICVYTCTLTHICFCMHAMYVCMYLGMYVCMYVCIRLSLSIYLSVCLSITVCLSTYLLLEFGYSSAYIRKHIIHTCVQGCAVAVKPTHLFRMDCLWRCSNLSSTLSQKNQDAERHEPDTDHSHPPCPKQMA